MNQARRAAGWVGGVALLGGIMAGVGIPGTPAWATPPECISGTTAVTCTFSVGQADWSVPAGITQVNIVALGAEGGSGQDGTSGGLGGEARATISVSGGAETLQVNVGGQPTAGNGTLGGFNGGGDAASAFGPGSESGGGGGGASDVRTGSFGLADRIIVAGGGGGGGTSHYERCLGGAGGGSHGGHAARGQVCDGGSGGTQQMGGSGVHDGAAGTGGAGGDGPFGTSGGNSGAGGGGGYFGGGGGGGGYFDPEASGGGGGGSGFIAPSAASPSMSEGVQRGNGQVTITYDKPLTTTTAQDAAAPFATKVQTVALTATVTSGGAPVNEGTVTFAVLNGTSPLSPRPASAPVIDGTARGTYFVPANTAAGSYTIRADYGGSSTFLPSSDSSHTLFIFGPGR